MAVNCGADPTVVFKLAGVTAIDCRTALLTINDVVPVTPANVAVIVIFPGVSRNASPWALSVLLTVATTGLEELQVTRLVIFCVVLSE